LYNATAPQFQPRADERREYRAKRRPGGLGEQLVLELAPVALRREHGTDQSGAGPEHVRESVAGRDAARERHCGEEEMAEEDFHEVCIT
jgi:hypothetical protein